MSVIGVGFPFLTFALVLWVTSIAKDPATGFTTPPVWNWIAIGDFVATISFKVDRLSLLMSLIVSGVGSLIHWYSIGYMAHDKGYARYFAYLNLFLSMMLILVLAGNLPLLFVGWEGVGLCSYLLIGFWFEDPQKAYAGKKAFIVNRIGDFGFLLGMFLLYSHLSAKGIHEGAGLLSFEILEKYRGDLFLIATPVCLLLFLGAVGKSAQIPLYVWLPDAMAGPTPVSALIHAATMVTAGVYLLVRLHFLYTLSPVAMEVVAVVGIATTLFAGIIGLLQNDIKKILAYSTISQLGFMFFAVGSGAFAAAIFHMMTHAFFKAALFLGAGSVIHGLSGEQDIWKMGGLRFKMPMTFCAVGAGILALAGIFPFAGFFSKDLILWQGFATGHKVLWGLGFLASGITVFYAFRLFAVVFMGRPRNQENYYHAHDAPLSMTIPLLLLGLLSLVSGWIGIPEILKGGDPFLRWLAPLFPYENLSQKLEASGHGMELLLMIITFLWVFHLGLFALLLYSQKLNLARRGAEKFPMIREWIVNKFYIDELYQGLFVRPIQWFSEKILWRFNDDKVIDSLLVDGSAKTMGLLGQIFAMLQTGVVQTYALFFAIGAILVIGWFAL